MGECVGVDVSKQHLDWVIGAKGRRRARSPNSPAGVRRLISEVEQELGRSKSIDRRVHRAVTSERSDRSAHRGPICPSSS